MQTKNFGFQLGEIKADGAACEFSGWSSVFDVVDMGNDRVERTAFDRTLRERKSRPLLWQHDVGEPIGRELELRPDGKGLFGRWRLADTSRGRDAAALLRAGIVTEMSIGYQTVKSQTDNQGIRHLLDVELLENSLVTFAMNDQATIADVKRRTGSQQKGLNLLVELELARRRLTSQGILMSPGPHGIHMEMIRRRIAMRERGIVPPTTSNQRRRGR